MKAWILEKLSNIDEKPLKLTDVPLPVPDKQEVLTQCSYKDFIEIIRI
jgi:NADPH:quinone reductase-like Zn-dependent oxidoreductase